LLELFHANFSPIRSGFPTGVTRRAYEQLANLELELRDSGMIYSCPGGLHDDLGLSCAMLAWAAQHPHLQYWMRNLQAALRPRKPREKFNWGLACT
jgi:hypothetical protein